MLDENKNNVSKRDFFGGFGKMYYGLVQRTFGYLVMVK